MKKGPIPKPLAFETNLNDCHICTSHKPNGDGYPYLAINGKHWRANRYVYTINFGEIPSGLIVRHKCDERLCINPDHLELGTLTDNNRDRVKRGRNRDQTGEKNNMAKLTKEQVIEIFISNKESKVLSLKYNISITTINLIKKQEIWKELTKNIQVERNISKICKICPNNNIILNEFSTLEEAAKSVNLKSQNSIAICIKDSKKTAAGFYWKRINKIEVVNLPQTDII